MPKRKISLGLEKPDTLEGDTIYVHCYQQVAREDGFREEFLALTAYSNERFIHPRLPDSPPSNYANTSFSDGSTMMNHWDL